MNSNKNTKNENYAQRLLNLQDKEWKKKLKFLNPYKYHLSFICKGQTLEVGCGIGRVLNFIPNRSVGVDHNSNSIKICKSKNLKAYTSKDFFSKYTGNNTQYDTLLFSHVLEHMTLIDAQKLLETYLPFLKKNGKLILITPQEKGYDSDSTHIHYMNKEDLKKFAENNLIKESFTYSFPFPNIASKYFIYNENVFIGIKYS